MLKKIVYKIDDVLGMVSAVLIAANCFLLSGNVVLRLFGAPIASTMDYVGLISAVITAFAMPYVSKRAGHIRVEMLESKLGLKGKKILSVILLFFDTLIIGVIGYECILYTISSYNSGSRTWVAFIPYWPVVMCISIGFLFYSLTSAIRLMNLFRKEDQRD